MFNNSYSIKSCNIIALCEGYFAIYSDSSLKSDRWTTLSSIIYKTFKKWKKINQGMFLIFFVVRLLANSTKLAKTEQNIVIFGLWIC